jgi:hypothetical protein
MDDIQRADYARQVLDNPLYAEAWQALGDDLTRQRVTVKLSDTETHTRLIIAEQIMAQLRGVFTRAIQDGEIAKIDLARRKTTLERVFRR